MLPQHRSFRTEVIAFRCGFDYVAHRARIVGTHKPVVPSERCWVAGVVHDRSQRRTTTRDDARDNDGRIARTVRIESADVLLPGLIPQIAIPGQITVTRAVHERGLLQLRVRTLNQFDQDGTNVIQVGLKTKRSV